MNKNSRKIFTKPVSGKKGDKFVGFKMSDGAVTIYHPEQYSISVLSKTFREDVICLLESIHLAKKLSPYENVFYDTAGVDKDSALYSYFWIIKDYLTNGLPEEKRKKDADGLPGKINWKKTLRGNFYIMDGGRTLFFNKLKVSSYDSEDTIITRIYKICLNWSVELFGWIYGLDHSPFRDCQYVESELAIFVKLLSRRAKEEYNDIFRTRLNHLITILTGFSSNVEKKETTYGVESYYYVYECMIDSIFGNVADISEFYPKGKWCLSKNNLKPKECVPLREDTINIQNSEVFVIDAKYYRYGHTQAFDDLPGSSSIHKQITYAEHIKNNLKQKTADGTLIPYTKVYNIFILPYNKNSYLLQNNEISFSEGDIAYIGYAIFEDNEHKNEYDYIYTFLFDLNYLIHNWKKIKSKPKSKELFEFVKTLNDSDVVTK